MLHENAMTAPNTCENVIWMITCQHSALEEKGTRFIRTKNVDLLNKSQPYAILQTISID